MARPHAPRMLYLVNARLPTEKAHGVQVVQMCQAFSGLGFEVELWHPRRRQRAATPGITNLFAYYGVPPSFRVRTLPNLDPMALIDRLPERAAPVAFLAHTLGWGLFAAARAARRRWDLCFTRDACLAFWLVLLGQPTVCELHQGASGAIGWLLRRMARRRSLRLVVTLTKHGRLEAEACGVPEAKLWVAPDGVDPSAYAALPARDECRLGLGLSLDTPIVGYVGRFEAMGREKGVRHLIDAMSHLPDDVAPCLLCVGGPMDRVNGYRARARSLGLPDDRVRFLDRVPAPEVPLWIRACDVVTIPLPRTQFFEHFTSPMKLFEYMAAGVPIVASDLPSLREVLCDGRDAVLVEAGNPAALAGGLARVLRNPVLAASLARAARCEVPAYGWDRRAAGIVRQAGVRLPLLEGAVR